MRRLLLSGSHGLIGGKFAEVRRGLGDEVVPLLRQHAIGSGVRWLRDGSLDPLSVSGFDAVIHLAGEPVAKGRWTDARKRAIRDSRVDGTRRLVEALRAAPEPPKVLLCASGINVYGDRGTNKVDEQTPPGTGFLAEVCMEWEAAAQALGDALRVVTLRIGAVLTPQGGVLATMMPLFRMALAGPIAGGNAYVSWVTLDDAVRAIRPAVESAPLRGAVNVVSPEPVQGREFTREVAAAVGKPAIFPVPGWAVRLAMGQMAEETVLTSIRAIPRVLMDDGFTFVQPNLRLALEEWKSQGEL